MSSQDVWDARFLSLATFVANYSKDPSTKIGAVVVGETPNLVAIGWNGFPPGVADSSDRLNDRETKYRLVVHGEINALINAPFKPIHLYITQPPCIRCAVQILAYRSVERVITYEPTTDMLSRWGKDFDDTVKILDEADVALLMVPHN